MQELNKQACGGLLRLFIAMALALFVPAGTLAYPQAWIFLAVFFACTLAITFYLMKNDPELLKRRMKARLGNEQNKSQKIIQGLVTVLFFTLFVLSALDYRAAPNAVSLSGVATRDMLVALGFLIVFFTFRENSFASAVIEIAPEQKVIATGPYARVRHPMYSGALVMLAGVPLALGSIRGLIAVLPILGVIVWRLLNEEEFLARNLPGYAAYRDKAKYRLAPFIW